MHFSQALIVAVAVSTASAQLYDQVYSSGLLRRVPAPKGGSGGKPSGGKPSGGKPSGGKPSGGKPSGGKPSGGKPSGGKPSGGKPSGGKPSGGKPSGGKPSGGSPSGGGSPSSTANTNSGNSNYGNTANTANTDTVNSFSGGQPNVNEDGSGSYTNNYYGRRSALLDDSDYLDGLYARNAAEEELLSYLIARDAEAKHKSFGQDLSAAGHWIGSHAGEIGQFAGGAAAGAIKARDAEAAYHSGGAQQLNLPHSWFKNHPDTASFAGTAGGQASSGVTARGLLDEEELLYALYGRDAEAEADPEAEAEAEFEGEEWGY